jgi:hypothetical protein
MSIRVPRNTSHKLRLLRKGKARLIDGVTTRVESGIRRDVVEYFSHLLSVM